MVARVKAPHCMSWTKKTTNKMAYQKKVIKRDDTMAIGRVELRSKMLDHLDPSI